jgi:hypothetical protein
LTVDKNRNAILSAMMVAGKKEINNTFTGVMMGDIRNDNDTNIKSGLLGF